MSECGRDCACKEEPSRRDVLKLGIGTAGLLAAGARARAAEGDIPAACKVPPPQAWFDELLKPGEPITYRGEQLRNLLFPLGGIGTGTLWLNGAGRLVNWQIFNNIQKNTLVDDSFLAVRVQEEGRDPVVRALQTVGGRPFQPAASLEILGRYPLAAVRFADRGLAVDVELHAWNPLIPLREQDSAIPCAIFTIKARNKTSQPVRVSFLASQQNAVGHMGAGVSNGVSHATYGGNRNRLVQGERLTAVAMSAEPGKPAEIRPGIQLLVDHHELPPIDEAPVIGLNLMGVGLAPSKATIPTVYWLANGDLRQLGGSALTEIVEGVRDRGAMLLLSGVANPLMEKITVTAPAGKTRVESVFESFDAESFGKWTAAGDAFRRPRPGTAANQNPVSGFLGPGLVNTYEGSDAPQGTLISPRFVIQHPYLSFLVGGGQQAECAVRLKVEGKVALSASGRNTEQLERIDWDVSKWMHQEAEIEIVDKAGGGWGHILVDDIRFANLPVSAVTEEEARAWNAMLDDVRRGGALSAVGCGRGRVMLVPVELGGSKPGVDRLLQRDRVLELLASLAGATYHPAAGRPPSAPSFGTMCLATSEAQTTWRTDWTSRDELFEQWSRAGTLDATPPDPAQMRPATPAGETVNAALSVDRTIQPGEETQATFVLAWHFPHQYYPQNSWKQAGNPAIEVGNMYANWFTDATVVAAHVLRNLEALRGATMDYVRALYDTTLPQYLVDAAAANVSILRSPTCFWTKDGTFYGFEGCNPEGGGCCPMNCNHVWNYEQTLAKIWPALERNMRVTELDFHQQADGGLNHRVSVPRDNPAKSAFPVADGQCGAVLKAYREHLQSPDRRFLDDHWEKIKKAMEYAIATWDADGDGVMETPQFNTYDRVIYGHNTFISSLYLAALRAAEEMAKLSKDADAAQRYRTLFERGRDKIAKTLYDGEYYIQKADNINLGYGTGCLSDQVVGQWWARVLGLGDILPVEQVRSALTAIFKHNFLWKQEGFQGTQRFLQFADGNDKGLLVGSWPKGGRPQDPILYRDEIWTGIEYQVAAHKLHEGQILEALAIVRGARERYDGDKKSPWNEIECGDYYARAMSAWSLLLAAQGYLHDGPEKLLQFDPRLGAEDHRSLFTTAEGWGRYQQKRDGRKQAVRVELLAGRCDLRTLRLGVPADAKDVKAVSRLAERDLNADVVAEPGWVTVELRAPVTLEPRRDLSVDIEWS